jgi:hypothetical protein
VIVPLELKYQTSWTGSRRDRSLQHSDELLNCAVRNDQRQTTNSVDQTSK